MTQPIPHAPAALIFDLDGTLADTEPAWIRAKAEVAADQGAQVSDALLDSFTGYRILDFLEHVLPDHTPDHRVELVREVARRARLYLPEITRPMPGAINFVRHAQGQGHRMAVCSSSATDLIEQALTKLAIRDPFEVLVSGFDMPRSKPDPAPYLETLRLLGIAADQTVAFEDSPAGITSATAAGIATIGLGPHAAPLADICAAHIADLGHAYDLIGQPRPA
jgi:HAD superfamily hydrolase (TIGR01509 family)